MTSPYLTDDCIYNILKYLKNYRSTLFNCLLVNRFWCKATIPLLYVNPFNGLTNQNNYSIILTLILSCNKDEILQLKNKLEIIGIYHFDVDAIDIEYKPLFEYPKYIEIYNYSTINSIIFQWLRKIYLNIGICEKFCVMFHQSILLHCDHIKQLNIDLDSNYLFNLFNNDINVHFIKALTQNLSKLNSLVLSLRNIDEIMLEFLDNIGINLRKLEMYFTYSTTITTNTKEKFCTMIQKQNNLKVFKVSCHVYLLVDILLSLEFQKHSLVCIEFENVHFNNNISFKNFINLYNLNDLKFYYCMGLSLNQIEILKFASFKLEEMTFQNNDWDGNILSLIIKYLGASLQRLFLLSNKELVIPTIENISIYCSNLITLEITIDSSIDLLVFPYLKNLKIRKLYIYFLGNYNTNEIFVNLANSLPISAKEISITFDVYDSSHIEKFLENCHGLEIFIIGNFIELESLKIILNYTERNDNNLKLLKVTGLDKKLTDEELKLLDQIKAKGVKVAEILRIYEE